MRKTMPLTLRKERFVSSCIPDETTSNSVEHPDHYNWHPAGIECQDVIEHFSANIAQAIKYLWRHNHKGNAIEDLKKARQQIDFEIARLERWGDNE